MSKQTYIKHVGKEIKRINDIIDFKILHGLDYKSEIRKHKDLLSQIGINKKRDMSFGFLSFFL